MTEFNLAIVAIGAVVLLLGLVSDYFRRHWWASDPLTALLVGIVLGPIVLGWLNPNQWGVSREHIFEQTARFTMAIGLMGVALRLPKRYFFQHWRSLAVLLGLVMPLMWLVSGLLVYWILGLPFWEAMMIGAAITPTDPIVATSIVTGVVAENNLPLRLRHIISAESGSNDGLAYPFVVLCVLILGQTSPETADSTGVGVLPHWFIHVVLKEVGGAIVFGGLGGYVAGQLLKWAERKNTIESSSFLSYSLALSITVLGVARLLGTDGILAVFIAGLAFGNVISGQERSDEDNVQEAINRFFTLPIFILLGLMIPWEQWFALGWRSLLLVVAVLLLRRLPVILLLYRQIPSLKNLPEALFIGWFGPVGVAAIFYAGYCLRRTGVEEVWLVCSLVICASIVAQGFTSTPLSRRYGKYAQTHLTERELTQLQ